MKDPNDTRNIGPRIGSPLWIYLTVVTAAGLLVIAGFRDLVGTTPATHGHNTTDVVLSARPDGSVRAWSKFFIVRADGTMVSVLAGRPSPSASTRGRPAPGIVAARSAGLRPDPASPAV